MTTSGVRLSRHKSCTVWLLDIDDSAPRLVLEGRSRRMRRQRGLTALIAAVLVVALSSTSAGATGVAHPTANGSSQATVPGGSAATNASVKRSFAVFRRKKAPRDVMHAKSGNKKKRAAVAAANSRLVYRDAKSKVYLVARDKNVCITRVVRAGSAGFCSPISTYSTTTPPFLLMLSPVTGTPPAEVVIPIVDGVATITRVDAGGTRTALTVKNNVVVDKPHGGDHYEWRQPSGATATVMNRR